MRRKELEAKLDTYFKWFAAEENCTVEEAKECIKTDWGKEGLRGYGIFTDQDVDALHIQRIDEMDIYDGDIEAARQARKDGILLIPYLLQPKGEPFGYYRYIFTLGNFIQVWKEYFKYKRENLW